MKKLFSAADRYLQICSWRDIALLKFCLAALGLLVGVLIPARRKTPVAIGAALVFVGTYIPLMGKFLPLLCGSAEPED